MSEIIEDRARESHLFPMNLHCVKCDSKVKVELVDINYGEWKVGGYYFAGTEQIKTYFTWDCPACGHKFNTIETTLIPVGIQQDAIAEYERSHNA